MKGLLHSKRFKENLYRWLFMYVGVIGLLTTVITYSKYITQFVPNGDGAKSAKFEAKIYPTNDKGEECTTCTSGVYRPTSKIKYYFAIETEFEVLADLYLNVRIKDPSIGFKITNVEKIDNNNTTNNTVTVEEATDTMYRLFVQNTFENPSDPNEPLRPNNIKNVYAVTIEYNYSDENKNDYNLDNTTSKDLKDIIEVGYTAEQRS